MHLSQSIRLSTFYFHHQVEQVITLIPQRVNGVLFNPPNATPPFLNSLQYGYNQIHYSDRTDTKVLNEHTDRRRALQTSRVHWLQDPTGQNKKVFTFMWHLKGRLVEVHDRLGVVSAKASTPTKKRPHHHPPQRDLKLAQRSGIRKRDAFFILSLAFLICRIS